MGGQRVGDGKKGIRLESHVRRWGEKEDQVTRQSLILTGFNPSWKGGRVEGWKGGRVEGWKGARVQGCKGARVEGWKGGRVHLDSDVHSQLLR